MENPYIVYVKTNSDGYITAVNSSAFLEDVTEWTEIDSGFGDKYHHAQGNYFSKPIMTMGGAYCYRMVDGVVSELTGEEVQAQETIGVKEQLTLEERLLALERSTPIANYTAGTWYYRGDRVNFDGKIFTCIAEDDAVCVWSPIEYPAYWMSWSEP